jgi:hypothetical protein
MKNWFWVILLAGCAGFSRDCSSCNASAFGSDWIVVQLGAPGTVVRCWKLENTAMDNESNTDVVDTRTALHIQIEYAMSKPTRKLVQVHVPAWVHREMHRFAVVSGAPMATWLRQLIMREVAELQRREKARS